MAKLCACCVQGPWEQAAEYPEDQTTVDSKIQGFYIQTSEEKWPTVSTRSLALLV